MSNTIIRKRLNRLDIRAAVTQNGPPHNSQADIEVFNTLAADGVISAETLAAIHDLKNEKDFDPYELCTTEELRCMLTLCEQSE